MEGMTLFHAKKCCCLASKHEARRTQMQQRRQFLIYRLAFRLVFQDESEAYWRNGDTGCDLSADILRDNYVNYAHEDFAQFNCFVVDRQCSPSQTRYEIVRQCAVPVTPATLMYSRCPGHISVVRRTSSAGQWRSSVLVHQCGTDLQSKLATLRRHKFTVERHSFSWCRDID